MLRRIKTTYQLPVVLMVAYLVFTLILYAIGPLAWVTYRPFTFWSLQILYIIMLILGWQTGINRTYTRKEEWTEIQEKKIVRVLPILLVIDFLSEVVNLFRRFFFRSFDIGALFHKILNGFNNPGASYGSFVTEVEKTSGSQIIGGTAMTLFNYIWDFAAFAVVLLATFYFKKLGKLGKTLLTLTYVTIVTTYVSTGTNIGIMRLVLAVIVFFVMKVIRGEKTINKAFWKKRRKWMLLATFVAVVGMCFLFDKLMKSRGGILYWDTDDYNIGGIGIDRNSFMFKIIPTSFYMLLVSASAYLTQGYYGMSLCLKTDWIPTFGLGNSMAIVKLLRDYVSDGIMNRTYQHRLEIFGWDYEIQWHSMYSWFANDVSFAGIIIIMFLFGMLFAMAYKDSIRTNNPFAHVLVYYFTLMAFFIPCNNQVFQSTYTMFSFFTVLILWVCTRGKKKIKWRNR